MKGARFLWPRVCHGAGYGVRTRDLHLGKVARYQLRQARDARRYNTGPTTPTQAPISTFFSVEKNAQVVATKKLSFTPIDRLRRRRGRQLGGVRRESVPTPTSFSAGSNIGITRSGPRRLPRPADCFGGGTPIRTGGKGFAVPCLTTWPCRRYEKSRTGIRLREHMERATGFEPATSTLARWRATNCAKPAMRGLLYGKNHECASINFQIVETDSKHDPNERQTPCST